MVGKVAIVLVGPQGAANIGAAARAMKNFGISDLRLVDTVSHLSKEALDWAVDASDILKGAKIYASLDDALTDLPFSAAFTRRLGRTRRRHLTLPEAASQLTMKAKTGGAALVFGREDAGLTNDEIGRCDVVIEIPTSHDLPSINHAQSVIHACYELARRLPAPSPREGGRDEEGRVVEESFATREEIAPVLKDLDSMLSSLGYENAPDRLLRVKIVDQFEKIFGRAGLTRRDLAMFEGLISRIDKRIDKG
jgi:tRNA/rRNA methyltransferase